MVQTQKKEEEEKERVHQVARQSETYSYVFSTYLDELVRAFSFTPSKVRRIRREIAKRMNRCPDKRTLI